MEGVDILPHERSKTQFDVDAMKIVWAGSRHAFEVSDRMARLVASDPAFQKDNRSRLGRKELFKNTLRKATYAWKRILELRLTEEEAGRLRFFVDEPAFTDLHWGMFVPAIKGQGTEEQQQKWLPLAYKMQIIGCYAQTELGHGSNVQGLETTATFDLDKDEFVIHSPTLTSSKWWPGGLGKVSTHAVVYARLITNGEEHGVHGFIVQLRSLDDHMPLPGITIGDIGMKFGNGAYNTMDNGVLTFDHVRIPRNQMLMRVLQVTRDGKCVQSNVPRQLIYGTMVFVRQTIVADASSALSRAVCIATRYSAVRRQFGSQDGVETHTLSIFTEFSPMADPSFEPGRPGESAVELGRIVDRGLRESRAVDTESLCVLAGKLVWAIRIDLHILDNGGNLVDAANIAALASLLTFRRPECTLGGEDGQEVIVHPPEEREPLPLIVHHLPIAITFAFFGGEGKMVVDPNQSEEAVMGGRMTVTVNANGDICAIQKPGGEGVPQSAIMHCLHLASLSAESITKKIKNAVEAYNTERALRKIKRHPTSGAGNVSVAALDVTELNKTIEQVEGSELSRHHMERLKLVPDETCSGRGNDGDGDIKPSKQGGAGRGQGNAMNFLGGPLSWDPYSKGVDPDSLKASLASRGVSTRHVKQKGSEENSPKTDLEKPTEDIKQATSATDTSGTALQTNGEKTLKDAVKPKNKRRKRASPIVKGS